MVLLECKYSLLHCFSWWRFKYRRIVILVYSDAFASGIDVIGILEYWNTAVLADIEDFLTRIVSFVCSLRCFWIQCKFGYCFSSHCYWILLYFFWEPWNMNHVYYSTSSRNIEYIIRVLVLSSQGYFFTYNVWEYLK